MNSQTHRYIRKALMGAAITVAFVIIMGMSSVSDAIIHRTAAISEEAYFVFNVAGRPETTFVIRLTDAEKIRKARDILAGSAAVPNRVGGVIVKSPTCYNPPWSFHLNPQSITFIEFAAEVCEASIHYVEDHLDEVGGSFLPGSSWCPISRLIGEIPKPDCPSKVVTSVSAASYSRTKLTAGGIAAAYGSGLSIGSAAASSLPLPTSLAGTTVKLKDIRGVERFSSLLFVSPTQINYIIPEETAFGAATVTVTDVNGNLTMGTEMIMTVGPSFFTVDASGKGIPAALALRVRDGQSTYEPVAKYDTQQQKFIPVPIDLGPATDQVFLVLFGTGFRVRGPLPAGPAVFLGNEFVEPLYIGAQPGFPGLDQVNLPIPRNLNGKGEVEIRMSMDDKEANPVRVSIK